MSDLAAGKKAAAISAVNDHIEVRGGARAYGYLVGHTAIQRGL